MRLGMLPGQAGISGHVLSSRQALILRSAWRRRIAPHAAMTLVFLDALKALEKRSGL